MKYWNNNSISLIFAITKRGLFTSALAFVNKQLIFVYILILLLFEFFTHLLILGVADLIAGLTVGLTVIPQGIAYALVAELPEQVRASLLDNAPNYKLRICKQKTIF